MKFDIIIGNPPYQKDNGTPYPVEIYSPFVINGHRLTRRYMTFITPVRWYNGVSPGISKMREILCSGNTKYLVDYPVASDVFEGTQISGGVGYFLFDACNEYESISTKKITGRTSVEFNVTPDKEFIVCSKEAVSILNKVKSIGESNIADQEYFWTRYDNISNSDKFNMVRKKDSDLTLVDKNGNIYFVDIDTIESSMRDTLNKYRVVTGGMTPGGGIQSSLRYRVINTPQIIEPGHIFPNYKSIIGIYDTIEEAERCLEYFKTRFVRFLIWCTLGSTSINRSKFRFVSIPDCKINYSDDKLYKKYGLSTEEICYIDKHIIGID